MSHAPIKMTLWTRDVNIRKIRSARFRQDGGQVGYVKELYDYSLFCGVGFCFKSHQQVLLLCTFMLCFGNWLIWGVESFLIRLRARYMTLCEWDELCCTFVLGTWNCFARGIGLISFDSIPYIVYGLDSAVRLKRVFVWV